MDHCRSRAALINVAIWVTSVSESPENVAVNCIKYTLNFKDLIRKRQIFPKFCKNIDYML